MIEAKCDCGHKLVIFPQHAGTMMDCPKCGAELLVPGDAPEKPKPGPVFVPKPDTLFSRLIKAIFGD